MNKQIIIADDDNEIVDVYKDYLNSYVKGISIFTSFTGENLVERVKDCKYDLIIVDNEMKSKVSGPEALKMIRQFDRTTPIYMLSASESRDEALRFGATGYADKYDDAELLTIFIKEIIPLLKSSELQPSN